MIHDGKFHEPGWLNKKSVGIFRGLSGCLESVCCGSGAAAILGFMEASSIFDV